MKQEDPVKTASWQSFDAMDDRDISPADLEAVLSTADDADCESDFDLGEPWDAEFDPAADDDPE
jgi:hypothetical protein